MNLVCVFHCMHISHYIFRCLAVDQNRMMLDLAETQAKEDKIVIALEGPLYSKWFDLKTCLLIPKSMQFY